MIGRAARCFRERATSRWGAATLACVLLTAGCMATIPVDDPEVWSQRAELAVGERAVFDAGAIEIVLTEAGDSHALVTIDKQGVTSEGRLTTDPRGFVAVPPYQIRLVAADADETAIIEVTRPR